MPDVEYFSRNFSNTARCEPYVASDEIWKLEAEVQHLRDEVRRLSTEVDFLRRMQDEL